MAVLTSLIFIPLIILVLAIPTAIGIYVYRDAKSREMNAPLWTLIAILAPGFIGLIIYFVIRTDKTSYKCQACGSPVRTDFSVCPRCGTSLRERCKNCDFPLEYEWVNCPSCGTPIPQDQQTVLTSQKSKERSTGCLLALIIIIPILICLLFAVGIIFLSISNYSGGNSSQLYTQMVPNDIELPDSSNSVESWISMCNDAGKNTYVLKATEPDTEDGITTKYLIYCNRGYYDVDLLGSTEGGWFKNPKSSLGLINETEGEDPHPEYTLSLFVYNGDKETDLEILDTDNNKIDFQISDVDYIDLINEEILEDDLEDDEIFNIDIDISNAGNSVYSVALNLYDGDDIIETKTVSNADGSQLDDDIISLDYSYNESEDVPIAFSFTLSDAKQKTIYTSDKFEIGDDLNRVFCISSDKAGKLRITADQW